MSDAPLLPPAEAANLETAIKAFLAAARCAQATHISHAQNGRALVKKFGGTRPLAAFEGRRGARLVAQFLRAETGTRRRRPPGGRRGPIGYGTARSRLLTLRKALELAHERGQLRRLPEPWPIPRPGASGHVDRGRYVLKEQAEELRALYPVRERKPPAGVRCSLPPLEPRLDGPTLGEVLAWLTSGTRGGRTEATRSMRAEHCRHLTRFLGADRPVAELTGPRGYQLLLDLVELEGPGPRGRGVRFTTIRKRLGTLSLALGEAIRRGVLVSLPPWPDLPADAAPRERYLSLDEYHRLRMEIAPRWRLWFDLCLWTGQHSSDVDTMTHGMCDLGAGPGAGPGPGPAFFLRRNSKNRRRPEFLPMPNELRHILTLQWEADRRSGRPKPSADERLVGKWHAVRRALRNACARLGIPPVAPIDLRRTCATWWIEAGGGRDSARKYLGHSSTSSMLERHYSKITPGMLSDGVEALNRQSRRGAAVDVPALPPAEKP